MPESPRYKYASLFDGDSDDPMLDGFIEAIMAAEEAADRLISHYERAMAWAAIAAAYAAMQ